MAYRIAGTYVATCDCQLLCPCPVDGPPTGENGECKGLLVFGVREGNLDDTDLSGTSFALWNHFPSNLTAGNWTVGVVVDEGASDEQAQALERIVSGQEGGPFGDFEPLIGEYKGMERAGVTVSDSSASVSGKGDIRFEPLTGPDGSPTTVSGAMFGFAPTFKVGRGSGHVNSPAGEFDSVYGESADYEFSSEGGPEVHPRA
jgi:hypothetical protein